MTGLEPKSRVWNPLAASQAGLDGNTSTNWGQR